MKKAIFKCQKRRLGDKTVKSGKEIQQTEEIQKMHMKMQVGGKNGKVGERNPSNRGNTKKHMKIQAGG